MGLLLLGFLFALGINIFMFVPAYINKTDKLTDISYSVSFAAVAIFAFLLSERSALHVVLLGCVLLWALRLGSYLFIRINWMKRDKRFDGMREDFWRFLKFWLLQGASVFVVLLAALLAFGGESADMSALAYAGVGVFLTGLLLEATADAQKFAFMKKPKNKGKWIESGVWSVSRHPNYLGEIMVWSGVWLIAIGALPELSSKLVALISPLYITLLLLFVSGVPLLEKAAEERWGKDSAYQAYKRRTPVLIPMLRSRR